MSPLHQAALSDAVSLLPRSADAGVQRIREESADRRVLTFRYSREYADALMWAMRPGGQRR